MHQRQERQKHDPHDVLLHPSANQLQDLYPGRVALCLQCASCRCTAHVFWPACMATCLARVSFSPAAAVRVVLVIVWRSSGVWSFQCGVSFVHFSESTLLVLQDAIVRNLLAGLSEP